MGATLSEAAPCVDRWWREGRLALLLDGLDEVRDPSVRTRVVERIAGADLGANRLLLSARPEAYSGAQIRDLGVYHLCPIESREDRIAFLEGWIKELSREPAAAEAAAVHDALSRRQGLARALESPLLLRMLAHIYVDDCQRDVSRLDAKVRNRAETYQSYLRDALPKYLDATGRRTNHAVDEVLATARCVAYLVQSGQATTRDAIAHALQRHRGMAPDKIREHLAELREVWGLLAFGPESDPEIAFTHLTFQEYLCADWLAGRGVSCARACMFRLGARRCCCWPESCRANAACWEVTSSRSRRAASSGACSGRAVPGNAPCAATWCWPPICWARDRTRWTCGSCAWAGGCGRG